MVPELYFCFRHIPYVNIFIYDIFPHLHIMFTQYIVFFTCIFYVHICKCKCPFIFQCAILRTNLLQGSQSTLYMTAKTAIFSIHATIVFNYYIYIYIWCCCLEQSIMHELH